MFTDGDQRVAYNIQGERDNGRYTNRANILPSYFKLQFINLIFANI